MSNKLLSHIFALVVIVSIIGKSLGKESERHVTDGFIIYCPCMGRFGNQAEQLLGSLFFAKALGRTLVLPPFINYGVNHLPVLIPFEQIIQVEPIRPYTNIILLTEFMNEYAPVIWPKGQRRFYCYSPRSVSASSEQQSHLRTCDALKGQPFETFWTSFNISEDHSIFYKPLSTSPYQIKEWQERFPASTHPVLTFVGAPSPFPTHKESVIIQNFIEISEHVKNHANKFKEQKNFVNKPYLSMHVRHGSDWRKACDLLRSNDAGLTQLFSSDQCADHVNQERELPKLPHDICLPSLETIIRKLDNVLELFKLKEGIDIKVIHIATDYSDEILWDRLRQNYQQMEFVITPQGPDEDMIKTLIDIFLMANADIFIGNCISSFTAFPARLRKRKPHLANSTFYFGKDLVNEAHDEAYKKVEL